MQNSLVASRHRLRHAALLLAASVIAHAGIAQDTPQVPIPRGPSETGGPVGTTVPAPAGGVIHWPAEFIFFPPFPPPLDEPVSRAFQPRVGNPVPPLELSDYAGETFYPPLSTLLHKSELRPQTQRRLRAYRIAREELRSELQQELDRARSADAATRRRALEALARRQASRLAALEETAESLRLELVNSFHSWFAQRDWRLGESGRPDSPEEVAAAMQAYAHFHKDLSPEVRGLLREIAIEFATVKEKSALGKAAPPHFFFSPETARVRLPDDLPAPVAARIAEYGAKKSLLKKDLYDAVLSHEQARFWRGNTLRDWQAAQTTRFAELEDLAGQIRPDLAGLPSLRPGNPPSPLPAVLTERVAALRRDLQALQAKTLGQIAEIERRIPTSKEGSPLLELTYSFDATGLAFEVNPTRAAREKNGSFLPAAAHSMEQTRRAMAAMAEVYGRDFAENANGMIALRGDIARTLVRPGDPTADATLAATVRHVELQESAAAYRDYRTSVLEPGLSPTQRRLLFGNAIEDLRLPLPPGEPQPTVRNR